MRARVFSVVVALLGLSGVVWWRHLRPHGGAVPEFIVVEDVVADPTSITSESPRRWLAIPFAPASSGPATVSIERVSARP
jgi:hypothetical protein